MSETVIFKSTFLSLIRAIACYFNSLIQTIFQIKELLVSILTFQPPEDVDKLLAEMKITDQITLKRKKVFTSLLSNYL